MFAALDLPRFEPLSNCIHTLRVRADLRVKIGHFGLKSAIGGHSGATGSRTRKIHEKSGIFDKTRDILLQLSEGFKSKYFFLAALVPGHTKKT